MDEPDTRFDRLLSALETRASALDPSPGCRAALTSKVIDHAERFLSGVSSGPTFGPSDGAVIADYGIPTTPRAIGEVLAVLSECVDSSGVAVTSPRHLGYIPGGGLYYSALGDFLAAVSNRYAGLASVNPGAAAVENVLVRWLAEVLGLPASSGGTLTSGGSLAHLTAIHAARQATSLSALQAARSCIYLTEHTHHSVSKALQVCGLGSVTPRIVEVDDCYRMSAASLSRLVAEDVAAGLRPWLLVTTAGSTNTGAVDPLADLAEIAQKHGVWSHVDGA